MHRAHFLCSFGAVHRNLTHNHAYEPLRQRAQLGQGTVSFKRTRKAYHINTQTRIDKDEKTNKKTSDSELTQLVRHH